MNKRTFIKLSSAMMASPIISPLLAAMPDDKLTNWAGNLEYGTERLYSANSLEQVREFVPKQSKLKVLGTRHCFNTHCQQHRRISVGAADGQNRRAGRDGAHGDRRGRHELRPALPRSRQQGLCAAQPRVAASYFDRGRVQHRDAWLRGQERESGDGGFRAGTGDRVRRRGAIVAAR